MIKIQKATNSQRQVRIEPGGKVDFRFDKVRALTSKIRVDRKTQANITGE